MSEPQGETILETIERRLIPDEQAKKARGEVFTPLNLVREMLYGVRKSALDKGELRIWGINEKGKFFEDDEDDRVGGIPLDLWRDPNTKWLDPANGIGNFPFIAFYMLDYQLKRHGTNGSKRWNTTTRRKHIVEKMLYMMEIDRGNVNTAHKIMQFLSPGSKPNICCVNSLELEGHEIEKHFNVSEFDVAMGNPPFNPGMKWSKFITWTLPKCRILTFVLPSTFTTNVTGKKVIDSLKENGLYHLRYIHKNEFPGIGIDMLYLTTDKSTTDRTILINNRVTIGYDDTIVDYESNAIELSIFRKLSKLPKLKLYRGKNKTLDSKNPTETENVKFKKDSDHPNKLLSRLGGGILQYYWIGKVVPNEVNKPKIVLPRGTGSYNSVGTLTNISKDIVYTTAVDEDEILSDGIMYIPMESIDDYSAYKFYLMRSKFVRFIFLRMNHLSELTPTLVGNIPNIPVEKMKLDEDIYEAIGLDKEEQEYIDSLLVKK